MNRPDESGLVCVVTDRFTQFGQEARQVALRDKDTRPERFHQLLLGNRPGPVFEQEFEKAKRLRGKMNRCPPAKELACLAVENTTVKAEPHALPRGPPVYEMRTEPGSSRSSLSASEPPRRRSEEEP